MQTKGSQDFRQGSRPRGRHPRQGRTLAKPIRQVYTLVAQLFDKPHARYMLFGLGAGLLLLYIVLRIFFFIISPDAERYRELGKAIHPMKPEAIAPLRGGIYASDNRPIAVTAPVYRWYFDFRAHALKLLRSEDQDLSPQKKRAKDSISQLLSVELDSLSFVLERSFADRGIKIDRKGIRERWRKAYLRGARYEPVIRLDITYLQALELKAQRPLQAPIIDSIKMRRASSSLISQIMTRPEPRNERINPFGSLAQRTIGSVYGESKDSLSQGRYGLEMSFDTVLRGQMGRGLQIYGAQRTNLRTLSPAVDGYNVYTTLDMNIQNQLERIMRKQLGTFRANSGTAILLDVHSAKVLAITNLMRTPSGNYVEGQNFAVSDMSEPGSTFKVASMLVALEDGLVKPTDTIDVGNGIWEVARRNVRDHNAHHGGYGRISVSQVIERSSNVGVAKIIYRNYKDKPADYVKKVRELAFGHDLRLEIPGSAQAKIRMPNENWYGTTLAWMSFGYETRIPPIYTAAFFNAIANGGRLYKPYLVREVRDKDGQVIKAYEPQVVKEQIASPGSISAMQDMLRKVVTEGTGKRLNSKVVAVSGKSGTAQIAKAGGYRGADGTSHQVSFCGYFPSEAPRYTLMVVIREPSKEFAAGGGSMAGPVVKELAEAIISMEKPSSLDSIGHAKPQSTYQHIARGRKQTLHQLIEQTFRQGYKPNAQIASQQYIQIDSTGREHALKTYPRGSVPNVYGMSAEDANYLLMKANYKVQIKGYGLVREQSPEAGTPLARGKTVSISLN